MIARTYFVVSVNPALPVRTLAEFIDYAKANRGKISNSSPGVESGPHLTAALLRTLAGFESTDAQYRSAPLMLNAVMQGEVQWTIDVPLTSLPQYQAGKVRILATTGPARLALAPEVPTVAELGFPEATSGGWFAMAVPAGTPRPIIDRLSAEIRRGLDASETKQRLAALGFEPAPRMTPEETGRYFVQERARWTKVIVANNIRAE